MFGASKSGSAAVKDPQFKYDTLLLNGDGTNGAQNNTFLDSSSNNFTITRNGSTTQGTFTPFGPNWSNYFGTSSDKLSFGSSTNLALGSGDWTVEFWYFPTTSGAYQLLFDWRTNGNSPVGVPLMGITNTNYPYMEVPAGTSILTSSVAVTVNTWNHIAFSRSSNTVRVFVNGVSGGSASNSTNFGIETLNMSYSSAPLYGYVSNARIVKGTAVYTANFTPSTTPLTAITNTSLLTCQSNRFVDNSANAFAITASGTPSVQRFSPFSPPSSYLPSVIGGSMYFNGSTDTLSIPSSAPNQFGSGDLTLETWYYCSGSISTSGQQLFFRRTTVTAIGMIFQVDASKVQLLAGDTNTAGWEVNIASTTTLVANTWYHFATSRSGSTWRLFVNGVLEGTATASFTIAEETGNINIGSSIAGYLASWRAVKGTALYTSNFTPQTSPLTAITNTSLLLSGTNAGIYDSAMMNDLITVGTVQVSTAAAKYGTASIAFNSTGSYLVSAPSVTSSLGTGDFTIETWVYLASGSAYQFLIGSSDNAAGYMMIGLNVPLSPTQTIAIGRSGINWPVQFGSSITLSANAWTHIAITRSGTANRAFINGVQLGSAVTDSTSWSFPGNVFWVGMQTGATVYNGYMDDFRITKGYARYTANFTPPTAALPTS